jgi:hypothetical protein
LFILHLFIFYVVRYILPGKMLMTLDSTVNRYDTSHNVYQVFNPNRILPKLPPGQSYHIALVGLSTYASWFNISDDLGNRVFNYTVAGSPFTITLDQGNYSFADAVEALNEGFVANGHYSESLGTFTYPIRLELDTATNYVRAVLDPTYAVVWNTNLRLFFGFSAGTISATTTGNIPGDPFANLNEIQVRCSLVSGKSIENGEPSSTLFTFPSNAYAPNEAITLYPPHLVFVQMSEQSILRDIVVSLHKQDGSLLNLQGAKTSFTFSVAGM